ncbi:hypothetical protein HMPREF9065_01460 [Aggregatibacter sp. oral taxon 458 str. W10330]|nr:hypothetical protein HMPREF9065_01460 [Aggregatibacter sp. oral taxon 458 str. W10330]
MVNLLIFLAFLGREQPPPRGCVLKHGRATEKGLWCGAAASAWLCVETTYRPLGVADKQRSRLRVAVC